MTGIEQSALPTALVKPRVAMVQDGSRLHYAIPLAMQRANILERMFTDTYLKPRSMLSAASIMLSAISPSKGRAILGRRCGELDPRRIFHNPLLHFKMRRLSRQGLGAAEFAVVTAEMVGQWIDSCGLGEANAIFGFIRDFDPELFANSRRRGLITVGDQMIAPVAVELAEAEIQSHRFPGWEPTVSLDEIRAFEVLQNRTWATLDHFTCASTYVRDGLAAQGIAPSRISVLPYPINLDSMPLVDRRGREGTLTVGFVGAVNLRKGAPYFFETARRFDPAKVRFSMVGKVGLDRSIVAEHKGEVEVCGAVPRTDVVRRLAGFDILYFPTTCEGCAGAVIEAMASGLPVVTSPNSGTFARDGIEGFIHSYDDIEGAAESIRRLAEDAVLRSEMGEAARRRVEMYDVNSYSRSVSALFSMLLNPS